MMKLTKEYAEFISKMMYLTAIVPVSVIGFVANVLVIAVWSREQYHPSRFILMTLAVCHNGFLVCLHLWYHCQDKLWFSFLAFSLRNMAAYTCLFLTVVQYFWMFNLPESPFFTKTRIVWQLLLIGLWGVALKGVPLIFEYKLRGNTTTLDVSFDFIALLLPPLLQLLMVGKMMQRLHRRKRAISTMTFHKKSARTGLNQPASTWALLPIPRSAAEPHASPTHGSYHSHASFHSHGSFYSHASSRHNANLGEFARPADQSRLVVASGMAHHPSNGGSQVNSETASKSCRSSPLPSASGSTARGPAAPAHRAASLDSKRGSDLSPAVIRGSLSTAPGGAGNIQATRAGMEPLHNPSRREDSLVLHCVGPRAILAAKTTPRQSPSRYTLSFKEPVRSVTSLPVTLDRLSLRSYRPPCSVLRLQDPEQRCYEQLVTKAIVVISLVPMLVYPAGTLGVGYHKIMADTHPESEAHEMVFHMELVLAIVLNFTYPFFLFLALIPEFRAPFFNAWGRLWAGSVSECCQRTAPVVDITETSGEETRTLYGGEGSLTWPPGTEHYQTSSLSRFAAEESILEAKEPPEPAEPPDQPVEPVEPTEPVESQESQEPTAEDSSMSDDKESVSSSSSESSDDTSSEQSSSDSKGKQESSDLQ